jgi:hypothetical protein
MPLDDILRGERIFSFPAHRGKTFKGLPGMLADSLPDDYGNSVIFLFRYRKRYKNAYMVHPDSPFTADCNPSFIANVNPGGINPHPFDKSFGFVLGSNPGTAGVCQTDSE